MSYFPQFQSALELTEGQHQLSVGAGYIDKVSIHLKGTSKVWRISDAGAGIPPGDTPGHIIWASFFDDPKAGPGAIIEIGWHVNEGIFFEVPPGGVASVSFIGNPSTGAAPPAHGK